MSGKDFGKIPDPDARSRFPGPAGGPSALRRGGQFSPKTDHPYLHLRCREYSDDLIRSLADFLGKELGQRVIVVNKAGGAGTLGITELTRVNPTGTPSGCLRSARWPSPPIS